MSNPHQSAINLILLQLHLPLSQWLNHSIRAFPPSFHLLISHPLIFPSFTEELRPFSHHPLKHLYSPNLNLVQLFSKALNLVNYLELRHHFLRVQPPHFLGWQLPLLGPRFHPFKLNSNIIQLILFPPWQIGRLSLLSFYFLDPLFRRLINVIIIYKLKEFKNI